MPNHEASDGCKMKGAAPYFLVDDVFATAEFYRDFLGFTFNEFFGDPPSFTIVERDVRLHPFSASAAGEAAGCEAQLERHGRHVRYLHLRLQRR